MNHAKKNLSLRNVASTLLTLILSALAVAGCRPPSSAAPEARAQTPSVTAVPATPLPATTTPIPAPASTTLEPVTDAASASPAAGAAAGNQAFMPDVAAGQASGAASPAATAAPPTATASAVASAPATPTPEAAPPSRGESGVELLSTGALGFSDVEAHQLVRTSGDRVYMFTPEIYKPYLRALRAATAGTPSGFAEVDATGRPAAGSPIWAVDAAIDARDMVHLVYIAEGGEVVYTTFDTATDRWGGQSTLAVSQWPNRNNDLRQGSAGVAIAVDAGGVAHAVYGKTEGSLRRVYYNSSAGGWKNEQLVDQLPGNDNSHPTLAFAPDGTLYVAWLSAPDGNRGSIIVRALRNGAWDAPAVVDDMAFASQGYSIDQGPSLLVGPDGTVHIAYVGPYEQLLTDPSRYEYGRAHHRQSTDGGRSWTADDPPLHYTHNPSLWIDSQGNLVMFGHQAYWLRERCASMLLTMRPAGGGWSSWRVFADGCFDASVSTRWAQFHRFAPDLLDVVFWTEKGPNAEPDMNQLYYAEVRGVVDALASLPPAPER